MRRTVALMAVLGLFAAGLGCKHVGGKCDCQSSPSDAVMPSPSTPYPAAPIASSYGTTTKAPEKMPAVIVPPAPR